MTEHKTLNTVIHAAFRRDLGRFDAALGSFPDGSQKRADQLKAAWDQFSYQLHRHHQDEETIFWPALRELGADESLVGDLGGEHARMLTALERGRRVDAGLRPRPLGGQRPGGAGAIAGLSRILHEHLEHEERDLEPFSASHKATPEHKAAESAARKAHTEGGGTFFAWLGDGADADAAKFLRHEIPAPVLFMLTRIGGRDYKRRIASTW